jgi:hypothetical protein
MHASRRGTGVAASRRMAAVLLLVLLPIFAAVGFMYGVIQSELSLGTAFAGIAFLLMASGVFVGLANMMRGWERDAGA